MKSILSRIYLDDEPKKEECGLISQSSHRLRFGLHGMSGLKTGRMHRQKKKKFRKTDEPCLLDEPYLLLSK